MIRHDIESCVKYGSVHLAVCSIGNLINNNENEIDITCIVMLKLSVVN